ELARDFAVEQDRLVIARGARELEVERADLAVIGLSRHVFGDAQIGELVAVAQCSGLCFGHVVVNAGGAGDLQIDRSGVAFGLPEFAGVAGFGDRAFGTEWYSVDARGLAVGALDGFLVAHVDIGTLDRARDVRVERVRRVIAGRPGDVFGDRDRPGDQVHPDLRRRNPVMF